MNLTSRKNGFLDPLRKPRVAHADGQGAMPCPLEMVTSSWYGFARAEEALDEFFHPTDGLGPADRRWRRAVLARAPFHWEERGDWINGEGDCPKAAGPSHLLRARERKAVEVGWTNTALKRSWPPQQYQLRGMEGEAALEMAFIQQWGRGWLARVEGQSPGGLLPAGG